MRNPGSMARLIRLQRFEWSYHFLNIDGIRFQTNLDRFHCWWTIRSYRRLMNRVVLLVVVGGVDHLKLSNKLTVVLRLYAFLSMLYTEKGSKVVLLLVLVSTGTCRGKMNWLWVCGLWVGFPLIASWFCLNTTFLSVVFCKYKSKILNAETSESFFSDIGPLVVVVVIVGAVNLGLTISLGFSDGLVKKL